MTCYQYQIHDTLTLLLGIYICIIHSIYMVNTHSTILQDFNWRYLKHCKTLLVGSCGFLYNPSWHKEYKKNHSFCQASNSEKGGSQEDLKHLASSEFWARVVDKRTPCLEMAYWMSSQYTRNKNVDWCCNQTTEMLKGIWRILTCRMILKLDLIYIININDQGRVQYPPTLLRMSASKCGKCWWDFWSESGQKRYSWEF